MNKKTVQKMPNMKELMEYLNQQSGSVSKRDIARKFKIKGDDRKELRSMLKKLKETGIIETKENSKKTLIKIKTLKYITTNNQKQTKA